MSKYRQGPSWQCDASPPRVILSDPLATVYNEGQWRLNKVSPLYNLQYNSIKLKQYASKIRQALVSSISANSLKYKVVLEEKTYLKYSEDDSNGLMLTVTSSQGNNNKSKVAYLAIFLSWGVSVSLDGATHLPYMLEKGEQKLGTSVKSTLQKIFDCNIQQYFFTQHQLLDFGFNFIETDTSQGTDFFTLRYKTPSVAHKNDIKLSLDVRDVQTIWNGMKKEVSEKNELTNVTYQVIQNQIFHMVKLDVTAFDLCGVSMPKAEVKNNGIVKMRTPEVVNSVFTVLNDITSSRISDGDSGVESF